jgi:hypothetical protein
MPIDDRELTADEMKARLGRPPLMMGESEEEYWNWWMLLAEEYQPKTASDWLDVNDLAHKHWEKRRLQRYGPPLLEGAVIDAVINVLGPRLKMGTASDFARDYCKGDAKAKQRAREKFAEHGITEDHIMAEALQRRGTGQLFFDRMDKHRATQIRHLEKEMARRTESRRNGPDQADGSGT